MSTNLMILDLLENARITLEEALHLLTALKSSLPPQSTKLEQRRIAIKLLLERDENV